MKLVLLFFCIIVLLLLLIIFSDVRLNIKKCYISNIEEGRKKDKLNKEILIYVEFYLLGIIKIAKIRITEKAMKKIKIETDSKKIKKDVEEIKKLNPIELIKKLKIKVKKLNLNLEFGTESVMLTVYLIAFLSSIVRNNF